MIIVCCAFWSELVYLFGNVSTMHNKKQITRSIQQDDVTRNAPMLNDGWAIHQLLLHFYQKCGMKEARCEEMLTVVFMITTLHKPIHTPHNICTYSEICLRHFLRKKIQQTETYKAGKHLKWGRNEHSTYLFIFQSLLQLCGSLQPRQISINKFNILNYLTVQCLMWF